MFLYSYKIMKLTEGREFNPRVNITISKDCKGVTWGFSSLIICLNNPQMCGVNLFGFS